MENQNEDTLQFNYPESNEQAHSIIKAVGVGGGGSNAVKNMFDEGVNDVTYLIINTDKKALESSPVPNKLQISEDGLGAGADPSKAEAYALQYEEAIRTALNDGTKMAFITAGMGGGTGTGASPIVARVARELGILTIGIVTIPFDFEGIRKIQQALRGVAEIRKNVDALLVVNNTRLAEIYPDLNFFNAFKKADDTLTIAAKSISDIINITGYINLDFEDVKRTLQNSGVALISTGQASGENRLSKAIQNAITSPLLQDNEITKAERLLFEVCFSESNPMNMSEVRELNEFVSSLDPNIEVIWGALTDNSLGDDIRIIVLAAGFDMDNGTGIITPANNRSVLPRTRVESTPAPAPVAPQPEPVATPAPQPAQVATQPIPTEPQPVQPQYVQPQPVAPQPVAPQPMATQPTIAPAPQVEVTPTPQPIQQQPTPMPEPVPPSVAQPIAPQPAAPQQSVAPQQPVAPQPIPTRPAIHPVHDVEAGLEEIRRYYGEEKAEEMRMEEIRKNYYLLNDEDLTNEQLVAMLERMPAYNRSYEQLCELKSASRSSSPSNTPKPDGSIF